MDRGCPAWNQHEEREVCQERTYTVRVSDMGLEQVSVVDAQKAPFEDPS